VANTTLDDAWPMLADKSRGPVQMGFKHDPNGTLIAEYDDEDTDAEYDDGYNGGYNDDNGEDAQGTAVPPPPPEMGPVRLRKRDNGDAPMDASMEGADDLNASPKRGLDPSAPGSPNKRTMIDGEAEEDENMEGGSDVTEF
jgi:hypothetical protein